MSQISRRPAATQDLVAIFHHYAQATSITVADQFFAQAEATFTRLSLMPGVGTSYELEEPLFADIRYFPVTGFKRYLVFYRPIQGGIEVFRVLHGSRDIHSILFVRWGIEEADDKQLD